MMLKECNVNLEVKVEVEYAGQRGDKYKPFLAIILGQYTILPEYSQTYKKVFLHGVHINM